MWRNTTSNRLRLFLKCEAMIELVDDSYTDKEFCRMFKIDRATALRWREQGIVAYHKMPNGQIRYRREAVQELWDKTEHKAAA